MRKFQLALLLVGVGALTWMVVQLGPGRLLDGLLDIGWGFALTSSCHFTGLMLDSVVLRAGAGKLGKKVPYLHYARTSIAGHGINEATPFGKVGEIVKYSLLTEQLPPARSAGALVTQNIASFVVNCGLIALGGPIAVAIFDVGWKVGLTFCAASAIFFAAGLVGLLILRKGLGSWPFKVARKIRFGRFRFGNARLKRWEKSWRKVEKAWKEAAAQPGALWTIWLTSVGSRLANIAETALMLYVLGGDNVVWAAFLSLATSQFTGWMLPFVPMGAGTAEGSAYLVFSALGISPELGVLVEIGRKLRRIVFITLGVSVLGFDTFRQFVTGSKGEKPADDDDDDEPAQLAREA